MKITIECSIAEVIDKITILEIKLNKSLTEESFNNINKELNSLNSSIPSEFKHKDTFKELKQINSKLWILEDLIRTKSKANQFDAKYIELAEQIHISNDIRYEIKNKINIQFSSELREEKIYKKYPIDHRTLLFNGQQAYNSGNFAFSKHILTQLSNIYINHDIKYDEFTIELLTSIVPIDDGEYDTSYDKYFEYILQNLYSLPISQRLQDHAKYTLLIYFLKRNNYSKVYNLFNEFGYISGPNVHKNNMAYNDNETMLIYDGGGIGDKIMLFRFIYLLKQNVIFFVNDNLKWIFEQVCPSNVRLVGYKEHSTLPFFSSHCSLFYLIKALNLNQDNLTFHPYMESLQGTNYQLPSSSFSKKYIFNWKGNSKNCQEKFNRSVPLEELNNMFSNLKHSHQFIIVNKDITHEENLLLKKHSNVLILHDIDNQKTFEHTIDIIKKVDGVISSDTSIIHLSLTMGIASYLLLTKLCDWRWNNLAKWYPEAVCLQQQKQGEWKPVVEQLINTIR